MNINSIPFGNSKEDTEIQKLNNPRLRQVQRRFGPKELKSKIKFPQLVELKVQEIKFKFLVFPVI